MDINPAIEELLLQLGNSLGLGPLKLDPTTLSCSVVVEDSFQLTLVAPPSADAIYLAAPIQNLSGKTNPLVLRKALEANFLVLETEGCTLAIDADADQLLICRELPIDSLTVVALTDHLNCIASAAERFRKQLTDIKEPREDSTFPTNPQAFLDQIQIRG